MGMQMKVCNKCGHELPRDQFPKRSSNKDKLRPSCKDCTNAQNRANYRRNRSRINAKTRQWAHELRLRALSALGNKCVICGYDDWRALEIDHIWGDGAQERKDGLRGHKLHRYIADGNVAHYQLLCANCNQIKKREELGHVR